MPTFRSPLSALDPGAAAAAAGLVTGAGRQGHAPGQQQRHGLGTGLHPTRSAQDGLLSRGRTTSVDSAPARWMCSRPPAVRLPLPAVWPADGDLGTLTGG